MTTTRMTLTPTPSPAAFSAAPAVAIQRLDNGLQLHVRPRVDAPVAAVQLWLPAGNGFHDLTMVSQQQLNMAFLLIELLQSNLNGCVKQRMN